MKNCRYYQLNGRCACEQIWYRYRYTCGQFFSQLISDCKYNAKNNNFYKNFTTNCVQQDKIKIIESLFK